MWSNRYGDLELISARTNHTCHLCHEPVDLALHGATGRYGVETCNVDHLVPQSHGGGDDFDNLMIAHGLCNSFRGTEDVEDVRMVLAGTLDAPLSESDRATLALVGSCAVGAACGHAFANRSANGTAEFNWAAAIGGALLAIALAE